MTEADRTTYGAPCTDPECGAVACWSNWCRGDGCTCAGCATVGQPDPRHPPAVPRALFCRYCQQLVPVAHDCRPAPLRASLHASHRPPSAPPAPLPSGEALIVRGTGTAPRHCGRCGKPGHTRTTCGRPPAAAPPADGRRRCSICAKPGHNRTTCGRPRLPRRCTTCGHPGHNRTTCGRPAPVWRLRQRAKDGRRHCRTCGSLAHDRLNCPQRQH